MTQISTGTGGGTTWPLNIQQQANCIDIAIASFSVPLQVFMGMYGVETAFGTYRRADQSIVVSARGAVGPFQFTGAHKASGVPDYPMTTTPNLQQFQQQANAAAGYLLYLYNLAPSPSRSWRLALAKYNGGPLGVSSATLAYADRALHYPIPADWQAALKAGGSNPQQLGSARAGGTAGQGGTGTLPNDVANFQVGDVTNPDEDFWTAMNRLAQERYWYLFSDGETLYLADGPDLMKQTSALDIDRVADAGNISELDMTWDNTAWNYVATHKQRRHTQRRSFLAKITSPVEAQISYICAIDEVRAGDVVTMSQCGPGDGQWLAGDVRRSVFEVTSEINLVVALSPLTEGALNPAGINPNNITTLTAASGTAKRVLQAAIAALGGPYTQAFHDAVNDTGAGIKRHGTDCSGFVSYLMGPNGLNIWSQSYATPSINNAPSMRPGGGVQITIYNDPRPGNSGHVWIKVLERYFECAGGIGVHEMTKAEADAYLATGRYTTLHPAGF